MTTKKSSGHSHGFRFKSRSTLTKKYIRGVSFLLRTYKRGEKAIIVIDPRQHKSMPHKRYQGKVGIINSIGKRSIVLNVKLGNKMKTLITRADHIKPTDV